MYLKKLYILSIAISIKNDVIFLTKTKKLESTIYYTYMRLT